MEVPEKHDPPGTLSIPSRSRPASPAPESDAVASTDEADSRAPEPAERAIVDAARAGDREAFRTLVEQHQDQVFRLAMRVLSRDRETAEDVCQEVFLRAFKGLAGFDGAVKFRIWLHTIAMNASISEYRRQRTMKRNRPTLSLNASIRTVGGDEMQAEDPVGHEVEPGDRVGQQDFVAAVRVAVQQLPDEYREAVLLRDLQGLSYEEIGVALDIAPGTVRSRIHRGRLLLQQKLRGFA